MNSRGAFGLFFIFFCIFSLGGFAQSTSPAEVDSLITRIKRITLENYILHDKAIVLGDSLNSKHFYSITNTDTLVKRLNDELLAISNDKHLSLQYKPEVSDKLKKKKDIHVDQNKREKLERYGFEKVQVLNGNIGYIRLKYFADAVHAKKEVFAIVDQVKSTNALILDLRGNLGGNGSMIQLLSGIFLNESEANILNIHYTNRDVVMKSDLVTADHKYSEHPIMILCDDQTYSAGEALCLILKNRGRAMLVGSTTAGAGNVAGPYAIEGGFVLNVPVGLIVDPLTNAGWEHIGVTPDIVVNPDEALDKAFDLLSKKW
jgi:C-terminal processing protease CtpA/Prc